jgi:hypothetical protein
MDIVPIFGDDTLKAKEPSMRNLKTLELRKNTGLPGQTG